MLGALTRRFSVIEKRPGGSLFIVAAAAGVGLSFVNLALDASSLVGPAAVAIASTVVLSLVSMRGDRIWLIAASIVSYYVMVAILLTGQDVNDVAALPLVAIPVAWSSLFHRVSVTLIPLFLATATLGVHAFSQNLSLGDTVQLFVAWPLIVGGIAYGIHYLRSHLEAAVASREHALQQDAILAIAETELYSSLDSDHILHLGLQSAARLISNDPETQALFFLVEGARATLIASYSGALDFEDERDGLIDLLSLVLDDAPVIKRALKQTHEEVVELSEDAHLTLSIRQLFEDVGATHGLVRRIRVDAEVEGLLAVVDGGEPAPYSEEQKAWLLRLGGILELALSRALIHERAASVDALTGIFNRGEFDRRLATMPRQDPYAVLALDVDKLKDVNDTLGHGVGDELLQSVGRAIKRSLRREDIPARIGGDEFSVILPHADRRQAERIAHRILVELGKEEVDGIRPSISIGVGDYSSGASAPARLAAADRAMYAAKRAGGNRVHHAQAGRKHAS